MSAASNKLGGVLSMNYAKAIKVLQPSRAEMARRHAPSLAAHREAQESVRRDIEAGHDVRALYDAERGAAERHRAVVLLGILRR